MHLAARSMLLAASAQGRRDDKAGWAGIRHPFSQDGKAGRLDE